MYEQEDDNILSQPVQSNQLYLADEQKKMIRNKSLKFQTLVNFFNRYSNTRGVKKNIYMRQFLKLIFNSNRSPEFTYQIIRLIMPYEDKDRGNYGLKQKNLSKVIADSLNITKQDYLRLHHYKNPSFHPNGIGVGDFSIIVLDVVKSYCKSNSSITISQLNNLLDKLANDSKSHIEVFRKIFTMCNAEQIKWIIRIILKDLKINIKVDIVLKSFHKDAYDFYNLTNSIQETCKKFQDSSTSLDDQIKMFFPIRPMLAGKKKFNYFKQNNGKLFYVQTKYDGERLQIHKKKQQIKLFSRNAIDYTKIYQQFVQLVLNFIDAEQCILDAQIIVIEKHTGKMTPFGMNKMIALQKQKNDHELCLKIFDIMWLKEGDQDINLMKFPLHQRKDILKKIIKSKPMKIQLVQSQQISDYDEIIKRFSQSIQNNQQGIMLKDPNSLYIPKQRGSNWIKLKSDYIQGLTDTLDLLIIGGYYGDSSARHGNSKHWTDQITSFLVGVISRIDPLNSKIAYAIPFAKVGTGYSQQQLNLLRLRLKDHLIKYQNKHMPTFLEGNWKPALQDRPDCWISNLQNSIVLQIKAAEIITSDSYPTKYTLRFPRIAKIRYDKQWNQAQTSQNLQQLTNQFMYSKHMKRKLDDSDSGHEKERAQDEPKITKKQKRQKQSKHQSVYQQYIGVNIQNEPLKSHLFSGIQFCVLNLSGQKYSKNYLQKQILLNGGIIVQNPMKSTKFIVSEVIDFKLRTYQTQKQKRFTFIKPNYIINCIFSQKLLNLSPIYLTVLPEGNNKFYIQNYDRFGDSYIQYLNMRQLDQILQCMQGQYGINNQLIDQISIKYKRKGYKSFCIGLSQLQKIKLKMQDNIIVQNLQQEPNNIIIAQELSNQKIKMINDYQKINSRCQINYLQDLILSGVL